MTAATLGTNIFISRCEGVVRVCDLGKNFLNFWLVIIL